MDQDKYTLTWHTYPDHLRGMMKEMMMSEDFADVTLVTDDKKTVKAHRNILSACSSVFKDILQMETSNNHPVIYLRGIQYPEIESILQFIYFGEAKFFEETSWCDIERLNSWLDEALCYFIFYIASLKRLLVNPSTLGRLSTYRTI